MGLRRPQSDSAVELRRETGPIATQEFRPRIHAKQACNNRAHHLRYRDGLRPPDKRCAFLPAHAPGQGHKPSDVQQSQTSQPTGHRQHPRQLNNRKIYQTSQSGDVAYHKIWRQQQLEFSEIDQQADWVSLE